MFCNWDVVSQRLLKWHNAVLAKPGQVAASRVAVQHGATSRLWKTVFKQGAALMQYLCLQPGLLLSSMQLSCVVHKPKDLLVHQCGTQDPVNQRYTAFIWYIYTIPAANTPRQMHIIQPAIWSVIMIGKLEVFSLLSCASFQRYCLLKVPLLSNLRTFFFTFSFNGRNSYIFACQMFHIFGLRMSLFAVCIYIFKRK